jgi:glycosyltransferase involved in cell wall biosynthesis
MTSQIDLSIVCPMFNEAAGIRNAVAKLMRCIDALPHSVEVLLVNDGSADQTVEKATAAIRGDSRFRILSHRVNFGRGRALRTGIREARGRIVITTEGDLSWGAEVILRMIDYLHTNPAIDAVFASPHLAGGGYRNVPRHRVLLSTIGNRVLRFLYSGRLTMTTGMTRAYRASVIKPHVFTQDGKELHLEICHRLLVLGYKIGEVPAVLSWPDPEQAGENRAKRTDWARISRLIGSHMAFGLWRGVSRIIVPTLIMLTVAVLVFGAWAVYNLIIGEPSIYLAVLTSTLMVLWINVLVGFFMLHHLLEVQKEIWRTQAQVNLTPDTQRDKEGGYYFEERLDCNSIGADTT